MTIDRHEWYAPPLIYTRDDSTGLWNAKPAFQPDSVLPSSAVKDLGVLAGQAVPHSTEATCMGHMDSDCVELTANGHGVSGMDTNCEPVLDEANSRDEVDVEAKKRRVEDLSADGNLVSEYTLHGTTEAKLEDPVTMDNTATRDYLGAPAAATNASLAERVIEPTLVMFEVITTYF